MKIQEYFKYKLVFALLFYLSEIAFVFKKVALKKFVVINEIKIYLR